MKKLAIAIAILTLTWLFIAHRSDANARGCVRSPSPDGRYIAEECMLDWHHDENPKYVGRVYDAASGKLIVRRTFHTPVPEITWVDNHLLFQRGGDDEDLVILPPSLQDRVVSAFWQLTR